MKKGLILGVAITIAGLAYLMLQPSETQQSADDISQLMSEKRTLNESDSLVGQSLSKEENAGQVVQTDGGRLIVKGALPPKLKNIQSELRQHNHELQTLDAPEHLALPEKMHTDNLIAQADGIAQELDPSYDIAENQQKQYHGKAQMVNAELQAVKNQIDELDSVGESLQGLFQ